MQIYSKQQGVVRVEHTDVFDYEATIYKLNRNLVNVQLDINDMLALASFNTTQLTKFLVAIRVAAMSVQGETK